MENHSRAATSRPAILQIIPRLDAGGAERATVDIARALTAAGYRALVVSEGGRLEDELREAGGTLIRMNVASKNPLTMFANKRRLAKLIAAENIALVHARSRAPAWSALFAARKTRVPFVTTYHGIYNEKSAAKRLYNSVMARGDQVIANSAWTARHIQEKHPGQKTPVIIPRGLDLTRFDPAAVSPERITAACNAWGVMAGERVVLLPGRLTRWKGQLVLVSALAQLKREGRLKGVRAVLAGDAQGRDSYVDELDASIAEAGLRAEIIRPGHLADMPAAYLASDIVVSASTDPEAFGRVASEASAMRRPVVATSHGGAMETVLPGETGLLVPPGDAKALAEALLTLLSSSPARLAEMGARGRAHVAEHYSVERMCAATLAVYRDLLR